MKILITTPAVNAPNGGIANLIQLANHLLAGNDVTILTEAKNETKCTWRRCNVPIINRFTPGLYDLVIIGSPHSIWLEDKLTTENGIIFMQMVEHHFRPNDKAWMETCNKFYHSRLPILSYSSWNIGYLESIGREGATHYIPTAIDQNEFPIQRPKKSNIILIESPIPNNPSKDHLQLSLKLSQDRAFKKWRFVSYGAKRGRLPIQYTQQPSVDQMNHLYSVSSILLKATVMDARAVAPLEAMTKGCVTVRAVDFGDDDLIHEYNCLRSPYEYEPYRENAIRLIENPALLSELSENCYKTVSNLTWDNFIKQMFEKIWKVQ